LARGGAVRRGERDKVFHRLGPLDVREAQRLCPLGRLEEVPHAAPGAGC